ncbi:MAG: hypothetical protein ACO3AW_03645 [Chitinophagaceae bacterium]
MFLKYLLLGLFLYFIFRFVFDFVIPVVRTTKQVKKQFDAVREQQQQFYQEKNQPTPSAKKSTVADQDDYLEFEEVK